MFWNGNTAMEGLSGSGNGLPISWADLAAFEVAVILPPSRPQFFLGLVLLLRIHGAPALARRELIAQFCQT
jgi:hypothetical protein